MQLDAYAAEKAVMLNETNAVQAEVNQLGKKYAELLGHQNHKQKIKHLVKLKEENNNLKEVSLYLHKKLILKSKLHEAIFYVANAISSICCKITTCHTGTPFWAS